MKKIILLISFLVSGLFVFGQSDEVQDENQSTVGPWSIGGNISFGSGNNYFGVFGPFFVSNLEKSNSFQFNPVLTYGINNNLSVNLILGMGFSNQKGTDLFFVPSEPTFSRAVEVKNNSRTIGVSADNYFILNKLWGFRLELGTLLSFTNSTRDRAGGTFGGIVLEEEVEKVIGNNLSVFLAPNIDFFVGQRINIVLNLGNIAYAFNRQKAEGDQEYETGSNFIFGVNPDNIGLGMDFNF